MSRSPIRWLAALGLLVLPAAVCCAQKQNDTVKAPTRGAHYQQHEFTAQDDSKLDYWLMKPAQIDEGKSYPLVLTLHGRGGNTEAATVLASDEMRQKYPCFVLAPAVSRREVWAVPSDFRKLPGRQRVAAALELVDKLLKEQPIDPARVYVTGQSMGGFGSFGAIAQSPETFAAAMPVCGGWTADDVEKMKGVALWIFHGDADGTVPVDRSRSMVEAVKAAGGNVKYTEYPGVGHNSWSKTYASPETWQWLFEQRKAN